MKKPVSEFFKRLCFLFDTENGAEIGRRLNVTKQTVYKWRNGHPPSRPQLLKISQVTGRSTEWLFPETEQFTSLSDKALSAIKLLAPYVGPEDTAGETLTTRLIKTPTDPADVSMPLTGTISSLTQQIVQHKESLMVKVPNYLLEADQSRFLVDGDGWSVEGVHDGDLLLARLPNSEVDGKLVIARFSNGKRVVRRYQAVGEIVHLSAVEGSRPVVRVPRDEITIEYVVTAITRAYE